VTTRIPDAARRVLAEGVLCHVAARTPLGPHLTPVVYVLDGGRLWLTTSRGAVKARAWRRDPSVAGMVRQGDLAVTFRGQVRTYDVLDARTWPGAVAASPSFARAATRFSLKNARFFAGYAVDARRVPFAWTPPGRVFVSVRLTAGWVLSTKDRIRISRWGEWPVGAFGLASFRAGPRRRGIDLGVPAGARAAVAGRSDGALALDAGGHLTVLPARARRAGSEGSYDAVLPRGFFELSGLVGRGPAALTLDQASTWRAADMIGVLLRGPAQAYVAAAVRRGATLLHARTASIVGEDGPQDLALVRLHPTSAVWWEGWASGTVSRP
jgi:hypothetical protein